MATQNSMTSKLNRLETQMDALIENNRALKRQLKTLKSGTAKDGSEPLAGQEEWSEAMEDLRHQLAKSEASNQHLIRERDQVRERLTHLHDRLNVLESLLLDQRQNQGK